MLWRTLIAIEEHKTLVHCIFREINILILRFIMQLFSLMAYHRMGIIVTKKLQVLNVA